MSHREFTIEEANALVPELHRLVSRQLLTQQRLFCWRFGEESIKHYHELEEGFRGRKPLPPQPRHRLLN
jgi:hypothetical protein